MKRKIMCGAILCSLLIVSSALAQDDEYGWEKDILEITVNGGLTVPLAGITDFKESLGAQPSFSLGGEIGYFVTYELIIGFKFNYYRFSVDNDSVDTQHHHLFNPALYAKYYFLGESNWEPYVTGHFGLDYPKFSTKVSDRWRELSYDPVVSFGAGAGLFYFTSDYSGLYLEAGYRHAFSSETTATWNNTEWNFDEPVDMIDIHAGVRIFIGPGG